MSLSLYNGVIVVISGDVVNSMFCITLIMFVKKFTKGFVLWIIIHNHQYKFNRISPMVICNIPM